MQDGNTPETIQESLLEGQEKFGALLAKKYEKVKQDSESIEQLERKITEIKNIATLQNIDTFNADIVELSEKINNFKQDFDNNFINQNTAIDNNTKSFKTIEDEVKEWKTTLSNKIKTELDNLWDDKNEKFKKETRWWINFFSSKPTEGELEQQKNELISQSIILKNIGFNEITKINYACEEIKQKQSKIETLLTELKQLHEYKEKKDEEQRRQDEEKRREQEKGKEKNQQQGNNNLRINLQKPHMDTIAPQEINKIVEWLQTEQNATNFTKKNVIDQCRKFGVNNCDDFKIAFSQEIELEKMQEFVKNDKNTILSKKQCKQMMQELNVQTFEEFREKLNKGAQEIAETIDSNRANEIRDKLHNKAQNISDYVDYMNNLVDSQDKPLIKKVDINLLQAKAERLKKKLGEQNIFIKFLMLFGYDPDGLVTAYHMAKNRLKEAKFDERNNMLANTSNNIANNNATYSKPYFGNEMATNNNNTALFSQQSVQQTNTGLKY